MSNSFSKAKNIQQWAFHYLTFLLSTPQYLVKQRDKVLFQVALMQGRSCARVVGRVPTFCNPNWLEVENSFFFHCRSKMFWAKFAASRCLLPIEPAGSWEKARARVSCWCWGGSDELTMKQPLSPSFRMLARCCPAKYSTNSITLTRIQLLFFYYITAALSLLLL